VVTSTKPTRRTPPTLVTSSWSTQLPVADLFSPAPETYARIGISRGVPRNQRGFRIYRALQPPQGSLKLPPQAFTRTYVREVLGRLDARQVLDELLALADGAIPALLCFESPVGDDWCHRSLVSAWFEVEIGLAVPEFGREADGHGLSHPKLCAEARAFLSRHVGGR
jgi:hypothetical protein